LSGDSVTESAAESVADPITTAPSGSSAARASDESDLQAQAAGNYAQSRGID